MTTSTGVDMSEVAPMLGIAGSLVCRLSSLKDIDHRECELQRREEICGTCQ